MADLVLVRSSLQKQLDALLKRASEIENVLSDPGDMNPEQNAQDMEDDEPLAVVGDLTRQEIREIRLALKRIDDGTWGTCVSCGKEIAAERLLELPAVAICENCILQPQH
ncbi:MAG: TraR/DksA family transcriptional regulator [Planctomycetia bacterium]|jgi:RNA polymerase-binding transcription factor DksA